MSTQLIVVGMTVPLLVLEVATLAELGLLGRISTGMCVSHFFLHTHQQELLDLFVKFITYDPFLCRFSPFVKTGTESFVLGAATVKSGIPDQLKVTIIVSPEGTCIIWMYIRSYKQVDHLLLYRYPYVGTSSRGTHCHSQGAIKTEEIQGHQNFYSLSSGSLQHWEGCQPSLQTL